MPQARLKWCAAALAVFTVAAFGLDAQVTSDRILNAAKEPHNWLTYSGSYNGNRYSLLQQITPANVANLEQKWVFQGRVLGAWQSTPLVVDGIMYVTQRPNDVIAMDAKTGRAFWIYRHNTPADQKACCGSNNRGVAISRQHAVHGDARREAGRARRDDRPARCGRSRSPSTRTATR